MPRKYRLMVNEAVELLQALQCDDDPVFVQNKRSNIQKNAEIRVSDLEDFHFMATNSRGGRSADSIPAFRVMLKFYCNDGWVLGSLQDLVLCRLRDVKGFDKVIRPPNVKQSESELTQAGNRVRLDD